MTPTQVKDYFRSMMRDEVQPYLWSDTELFIYMDEAQNMFCRLGGGIADSSSPMCNVPVLVGDTVLQYDRRILKLRDVRRLSDGRNVKILNFEDLGRENAYFDPYASTVPLTPSTKFLSTPQPIASVIVGMEPYKMRLQAPALTADTLSLIVYRLPLVPITAVSTEFEIDAEYHRPLAYWMAGLALEKQDAETFDRTKSDEFKARFMDYIGRAESDRARREHKPRATGYGGL